MCGDEEAQLAVASTADHVIRLRGQQQLTRSRARLWPVSTSMSPGRLWWPLMHLETPLAPVQAVYVHRPGACMQCVQSSVQSAQFPAFQAARSKRSIANVLNACNGWNIAVVRTLGAM